MKKIKSSSKMLLGGLFLFAITMVSCKKTVTKEIIVQMPGQPIPVGLVSNQMYGNAILTPGDGMGVGNFSVFNQSTTDSLTIDGVEVSLSTSAGNVFSYLNVQTSGSSGTNGGGYISQPIFPAIIPSGITVKQGSAASIYVNLQSDVHDTGTVQVSIRVFVTRGKFKDTLGPAKGDLITFMLSKIDSVSLYEGNSTAPQFIATKNSAVDVVTSSYEFQTNTGNGVNISDLKFAVIGSNTASSIRVGNASAPFINGVASLHNIYVWSNGTVAAQISYPSVGSSGLPSGTLSQVVLTEIKYSNRLANYTISPNVAGKTMKLVGSKPTVSVLQPVNEILAVGMVHAIDVVVTADPQGDVALNSLPIQVMSSMYNAVLLGSGTIIIVKDDNNQTITTMSTSFSLSGISKITFTQSGGYKVPAGTTSKFKIFVPVTSASASGMIITSIVASDDFAWTDVAGGATTPYIGTTWMYNYPDYFQSVIRR